MPDYGCFGVEVTESTWHEVVVEVLEIPLLYFAVVIVAVVAAVGTATPAVLERNRADDDKDVPAVWLDVVPTKFWSMSEPWGLRSVKQSCMG